jgi:hypothetical protein
MFSSKKFVCTQCGYVGVSKSKHKGGCGVEVLLWLFFIIPGIIYSIWRASSKQQVCPMCEGSTLIPTDSPRGKKILSEITPENKVEEDIKKPHVK